MRTIVSILKCTNINLLGIQINAPDGRAFFKLRKGRRFLSLGLLNTISDRYRCVIIRLFIRISTALHRSPEQIFTIGSAPILSDGGVSWIRYSLMHLSIRISICSLPLSTLLNVYFGSDCPCKGFLRLIHPLYFMVYLTGSP